MSDKKVIAVVGATGSQGGGLVRAILDDPDHEFAVRALARDARSAGRRNSPRPVRRLSRRTSTTRTAWCAHSGAPMAHTS